MKKTLVRIASAVLILSLILAAGLFILGRYIATPEGSKWAISHIQATLRRNFATDLQFSKAKIDLFSEISIDDLDVHSTYGGSKFIVSIHKLDCSYAIDFLARSFRIQNILIDHPKLQIELKAQAAEDQEAETKKSTSGRSLGDLIRNPPVKFELENFELRSLELSLKMASEGKNIFVEIHELNLNSKFSLSKDHLFSSGKLTSKQNNSLVLELGANRMNGQWSANTNWQVQIDFDKENWLYRLKPLHFDFRLEQALVTAANTQIKMPLVSLSSDSEVEAQSRHFMEFDQGSIKVANDNTQVLLKAFNFSTHEGSKPTLIKIEDTEVKIHSELQKDVVIHFTSLMRRIHFPQQFFGPTDLGIESKIILSVDLMHLQNTSEMNLGGFQFFSEDLKIGRNKVDDPWAISGFAKILADSRFSRIVRSAGAMAKMGSFDVMTHLNGHISNDKDAELNLKTEIPKILLPVSSENFGLELATGLKWKNENHKADLNAELKVTNTDFGDWLLKTKSEIVLTEAKDISGTIEISELKLPKRVLPAKFLRPVLITHEAHISSENLTASIRAELAQVELPILGIIRDTSFDLKFAGDHLSSQKNLSFKITAAQELFHIKADGSANAKTKNIQVQIGAKLLFPKSLPEVMGQKLTGEVDIPLKIAIRHGEDLTIDGNLTFKNLGLIKQDVGIEGLNGQIPFSEHFIIQKNQFKFTELVTQNAFERVNFERLRPLLQSTDQISIQKIKWQEKIFGPLTGFVAIRQNMFFLHEFSFDLGSGGSVYGEMFFNAYPKNLEFGLLSRMTGIDLAQVLPKKFLNKIPIGDNILSARTGFVFSINKAVLDGRIDVTQIGSAQLLTLINVLDPQFQDDKMNKMRNLLGLGYPTAVAMNFNQGYLDLEVALNLLGISQDEVIRSIPLSGILSNPTAEIVSASQKGPLK